MLTDLQLDDSAPWKQRFRAPVVVWTQLAPANLERGLAVSNASGKYQLYAWDVASNALQQVTDRPTGILDGTLSGDGRYIYYLDDQEGNEIGHYVRMLDVEYLQGQVYLNPHPKELSLRNHV